MQFQQTASQRVNGRRSSSRGVNEQSPTAESGGEFPVSTETAAVQAPPLTQNVVPSPMNRIARKRPNSAIVEMSTRQESGRWVGDSFCAKHFAQIQNPPAQPIKRASSVQSIVRRSRVRARHRNWMLRITTPVQYSGILGKVFGIGKNSKLGYRSNLIHPSSPFSLFALFVSISLLLYLAIVMLVEIGFFWDSELCAESLPTFTFDIFVDCWFMFEILLCFFTGIYIDGRYHDEIRVVATKYVVSGALLFDVVTCVPETLIEFILRANYCSEDSIDREQQRLQELQIIQAMRLLRIFRLLRSIRILYRLGESISDVTVMIDKLYIPTFVVRMLSALFRIFLITHFCACIFWLIKTVSYTKEEMLFFEEAFEIYPDLDLVEKLSRKYVISFYYVNTIFTTVGFGDIVPHNTAERLLTVLLQHIGLVVFGFLLSEVQDIVGDEMSQSRDRDKLIQHARKFLQDHEVPPELMSRVIHWVKFDFSLRQRRDEQDEILDHIPPVMRRLIYVHLHQGLLNRIPFMTCISKFLREDILTDLFSRMQSEAFPKWLPISTVHGNQAHGLIVITKGIISAEYNDQLVSSLQPGDFFGENSLLVSYFWSTSRGVPAEYICETVAECLVLTRESFDQVIESQRSFECTKTNILCAPNDKSCETDNSGLPGVLETGDHGSASQNRIASKLHAT
jgi:CRP-like cAMP-binding protein